MPNTEKPIFISCILLLTLGVVWGTGYSIARYAMTSGVPPLGYSFWQSIGPAIFVGLILLSRADKMNFNSANLKYYFVTGLTGIFIPNTTMYYAAAHLPASILAVVVNIVPIIAYPLALGMRIEKFDWQRMLGIFFASIGLMLIILPKTSLPSAHMVPWVLFTLMTPLSFAFCSIYIARSRPVNSNNFALTVGMLLVSSLLLVPFVFLTHSFYFFHLPLTAPDWIILLEILLSSLGYILLFQVIKIAGPVYYSLVDTIVVLTGLWWGYFLFGETQNRWTTFAIILILFALFLVTRQQRKVVNARMEN